MSSTVSTLERFVERRGQLTHHCSGNLTDKMLACSSDELHPVQPSCFTLCIKIEQSAQPRFNRKASDPPLPTKRSTVMGMEQRAYITSLI